MEKSLAVGNMKNHVAKASLSLLSLAACSITCVGMLGAGAGARRYPQRAASFFDKKAEGTFDEFWSAYVEEGKNYLDVAGLVNLLVAEEAYIITQWKQTNQTGMALSNGALTEMLGGCDVTVMGYFDTAQWNEWDTNKDGVLEAGELKTALKSLAPAIFAAQKAGVRKDNVDDVLKNSVAPAIGAVLKNSVDWEANGNVVLKDELRRALEACARRFSDAASEIFAAQEHVISKGNAEKFLKKLLKKHNWS